MIYDLTYINDAINDLIDQKLHTYPERQNNNKRKANNSSRNNQQQQPHKKQNVAMAYTAGHGEKKGYTVNLPLCTKCNYHHIGQCVPKYGNYKRYGHTTSDCWVNTTNNNNKNQKAEACYECGNTRHIKRNFLKLKNRGNGNGNGIDQGRAYALGGRDASPDSNVITEEYLSKGCDVFLAHITTKEAKDKLEGKRLEDVSIVREFSKVFPKDLPGTEQVNGEEPLSMLFPKVGSTTLDNKVIVTLNKFKATMTETLFERFTPKVMRKLTFDDQEE
uniref:Reverse transcriptase domain-containing protein n=1 Tax=Tanacetum cinerariifolium TaxID=118510 RepID=A0A6L2N6K4_TANCI|nr:hypothetical protein [Tanacetum cinerariifolium]